MLFLAHPLHAKLYLLGNTRAVVTSANLTPTALERNHEVGFVATHPDVVAVCARYFTELWNRAGADLNGLRCITVCAAK